VGLGGLSVQGRRVYRWQAALAFLLALVGFIVVTQIRTVWQIKRDLRIPSAELRTLAFELRHQERNRAALEAQVVELRGRLAAYETAAAEGRTAAARLGRTLREMRTLVGLTPLEGPGIIVELNDSTRPPRAGEDPNKTILHFTDIATIVGELWAAGAEPIAINGERIVSSTGINCVGTTILCNTKRLAPPYVITAIGDAARMQHYLRRPGGGLELLAASPIAVMT
jgi:uncharacterized protein YlxW (UPF0749 family)